MKNITQDECDELTSDMAFKIVCQLNRASEFDQKDKIVQITMARVNRMMNGTQEVIEGETV